MVEKGRERRKERIKDNRRQRDDEKIESERGNRERDDKMKGSGTK